jgi:hypothetical protein
MIAVGALDCDFFNQELGRPQTNAFLKSGAVFQKALRSSPPSDSRPSAIWIN